MYEHFPIPNVRWNAKKLDSWYRQQLKLMIPGGMTRKGVHTNEGHAECCSDSDEVSDEKAVRGGKWTGKCRRRCRK